MGDWTNRRDDSTHDIMDEHVNEGHRLDHWKVAERTNDFEFGIEQIVDTRWTVDEWASERMKECEWMSDRRGSRVLALSHSTVLVIHSLSLSIHSCAPFIRSFLRCLYHFIHFSFLEHPFVHFMSYFILSSVHTFMHSFIHIFVRPWSMVSFSK